MYDDDGAKTQPGYFEKLVLEAEENRLQIEGRRASGRVALRFVTVVLLKVAQRALPTPSNAKQRTKHRCAPLDQLARSSSRSRPPPPSNVPACCQQPSHRAPRFSRGRLHFRRRRRPPRLPVALSECALMGQSLQKAHARLDEVHQQIRAAGQRIEQIHKEAEAEKAAGLPAAPGSKQAELTAAIAHIKQLGNESAALCDRIGELRLPPAPGSVAPIRQVHGEGVWQDLIDSSSLLINSCASPHPRYPCRGSEGLVLGCSPHAAAHPHMGRLVRLRCLPCIPCMPAPDTGGQERGAAAGAGGLGRPFASQ